MKQVQKTTTKGVICKDGKVFMVKDQKGFWEFPGGCINFGEQPKEALKREFLEELGVEDVKVDDIFHTWSFTKEKEGAEYHYILLFFHCEADLSNIKISDEHQEYEWIDPKEIDRYKMRDGFREAILKMWRNND